MLFNFILWNSDFSVANEIDLITEQRDFIYDVEL